MKYIAMNCAGGGYFKTPIVKKLIYILLSVIIYSSASNAQLITSIQAGVASDISFGSAIFSSGYERYNGSPPVSLTAQSNDGAGGQAIASVVGISTAKDLGAGISANTAILSPSILPIENAQASAFLTFTFYVTGPTATVESDILGGIGVHVGDPAYNSAQGLITVGYLVGTSEVQLLDLACQSGGGLSFGNCSFPNTSGSFDLLADLPVGTTILVEMIAVAYGYSAQTAVDPVFRIDPSVPNADQYAFVFPDGISNGASGQQSIPEPGSVALYGLGLSALVIMSARKRRLPLGLRSPSELP